jgi:hypothetical protein
MAGTELPWLGAALKYYGDYRQVAPQHLSEMLVGGNCSRLFQTSNR